MKKMLMVALVGIVTGMVVLRQSKKESHLKERKMTKLREVYAKGKETVQAGVEAFRP